MVMSERFFGMEGFFNVVNVIKGWKICFEVKLVGLSEV